MKRTTFITLIILQSFCFACNCRRGPTLPAFNLLLIDSTTIFNTSQIPKGKPVILVYFSPDCDHCQEQTIELLKNMDALKEVTFYFITVDPFDRLKVFNHHYSIFEYPNIILGKDKDFFFPNHFKTDVTPFLAIYDKHKSLRTVFAGGAQANQLIQAIQGLK